MEEKKTSVFSNGMIWFGAAVSIAEILTGTLLAPLGLKKGIAAIILGHLIGAVLMYFAGLIGANSGKSAMETVKISFGSKGAQLFSVLNVIQLLGWTAIMIINGAAAANSIADWGQWVWCAIIGLLIIVWLLVGIKNLNIINTIAMCGLFILTVVLSMVIFRGDGAGAVIAGAMGFGAAVELSVAMPLSWLPLISDYTRTAEKGKKATAVSAVVYFATSCWMYIIGLGAAVFTGESDIAKIMLMAGMGIAALIIIIFSTVTTTFLDAYSAGVSCESISKKLKETPAAVVICVAGTLLAIFTPITRMESFLYFIGSVFAPMIAVLTVDYFILKNDFTEKGADISNLIIWAVGFVAYRLMINYSTPVGITLPVMIITGALCLIANGFKKIKK